VARRFSRFLKILGAFAVLAVILAVTHTWWLRAAGYALVHSEQPVKADLAVVLGGDYSGQRIEKAANLVRQGYVPAVLVSGPAEKMYGFSECDLAIDYIVRRGYPRAWFIAFPNPALSTRAEAGYVLPELRRRGVRSFLLVTSDYHTARARRIYLAMERAQGGAWFRTIAAPAPHFTPDGWWRDREGQKTVFFEWSKTIATALGK
jgi:uncharacterized SAM-binding protein YcdF (DUF218 family)